MTLDEGVGAFVDGVVGKVPEHSVAVLVSARQSLSETAAERSPRVALSRCSLALASGRAYAAHLRFLMECVVFRSTSARVLSRLCAQECP